VGVVTNAPAVVAFLPLGGDVRTETLSLMVQAELANAPGLALVEVVQLARVMGEAKLNGQGLTTVKDVGRAGRIVGADFFCMGSTRQEGSNVVLVAKVVQVETTLSKLACEVVSPGEDVAQSASRIAKRLASLISDFQHPDVMSTASSPGEAAQPIPADWERPVIMVAIEEQHVAQPGAVDPAAQTTLIEHLLQAGFTVLNSESLSPTARALQASAKPAREFRTAAALARAKGADVLIHGEAISERGTSIDDFKGCRARVELAAIDTRTERVLLATSREAGATDLSEVIAGKKAVQAAIEELLDSFLFDLADVWHRRPEAR